MSNQSLIDDLKTTISFISNFKEVNEKLLTDIGYGIVYLLDHQDKGKRLTSEEKRVGNILYLKSELEHLLYLLETNEKVNKGFLNNIIRYISRYEDLPQNLSSYIKNT